MVSSLISTPPAAHIDAASNTTKGNDDAALLSNRLFIPFFITLTIRSSLLIY
jgi:hypothetical protein